MDEFDDSMADSGRRRDLIKSGAIVGLLLILAWLVVDPFLMLDRLRSAAKKGDRDALAQLVDFPAVRENLKAALNAAMAKTMTTEDMTGNPFAGLGVLLAGAMVDRYVDMAVTPDGIAMLTKGDRRGAMKGESSDAQGLRKIHIAQGYKSINTFHAEVAGEDNKALVTFNFSRRGFGWVLTSIDLPMDSTSSSESG